MKLLPAIITLILTLFFIRVARSQELFRSGSRYQALADASVALSGSWSVFGNQAGLSGINHPEFGGAYQNRFLVDELSSRSVFFVLPVQSSVFAVSMLQFGRMPFRQEKFGLSYARSLSHHFSFGVQFNYYRLFFSEDNRTVGSSGLEIGAQYLHSNRLVFGIHILNPYKTGIKMLSENFYYPSRINFGTLYHLSDSFSLMSELESEFDQHFVLKTGFEYVILEKLFLRTGISGKPYQLSAGIGFRINKLTLDVATSYHQVLGNSPSASFQYQF